MKHIRIAIRSLLVLSVVCGCLYPLVLTGLAQILFPSQANGSLIYQEGKAIGSRLIGQSFNDPGLFWGRLSSTGPVPYNAAASSGSNLGPANPELVKRAQDRITALRHADPGNTSPVPVDLVTASASGLDPHISPAAALYQMARVVRARGIPESVVRGLIEKHTQHRWLGLFGEPGVNILELNLDLENASSSFPRS